MTAPAPEPRAADSALLDELRTHVADHTPSCDARTDYLLRRAVDELARLAGQHQVLLARLKKERARSAEAAARTGIDECVISHSSQAGAFWIAAAHLLDVFEGPEAADTYMRESGHSEGDVADPDAGLRNEIARAIHRYDHEHGLSGNDIPSEHHLGEAEAVLAVRDRRMEQLAARVAELEKRAAEDAEDYAELANHNEETCEAVQRRDAAEAAVERVREYLETSDDDGIRTRETALRFLDEAEQAARETS